MSGLANRAVSVMTLGRMGFMAAYDVQMRYAQLHLDEMSRKPNAQGENMILLVEHTPVYTVGAAHKNYHTNEEMKLKKTGAEFYRTNSSHSTTFHGPGQLVAYPILNLHHFKPSLNWYIQRLEQALVNTIQHFGLIGHSTGDHTGICVGDRKISNIGISECRFVTTHGVSLNCNINLDWFQPVAGSGAETRVTSLSRELGKNVDYKDPIKPFLRCFQEVFDCELELKMLDEKELSLMASLRSSGSKELIDSSRGGIKLSHQAEYGLRHMSTLSGPANLDKDKRLRMTPMW